jgi:hypothetical protein
MELDRVRYKFDMIRPDLDGVRSNPIDCSCGIDCKSRRLLEMAAVRSVQDCISLDQLGVESICGVSKWTADLRDRADEYVRRQTGHENLADSLEDFFGGDQPSTSDAIGAGVLQASASAHACADAANGLRMEADRVDSIASFQIPPGVAYAQRQEYARLRGTYLPSSIDSCDMDGTRSITV